LPSSLPESSVGKAAAAPNKRGKRKESRSNRTVIDEYGYNVDEEEQFPITAYATCEEFNLKAMRKGLVAQALYVPTNLSDGKQKHNQGVSGF